VSPIHKAPPVDRDDVFTAGDGAILGQAVKPAKVSIMPEEQYFLGHISTPSGVRLTTKAKERRLLRKIPKPKFDGSTADGMEDSTRVMKRFRSFLGLACYTRLYVRDFARVAAPLNSCSKETRRKSGRRNVGVRDRQSSQCRRSSTHRQGHLHRRHTQKILGAESTFNLRRTARR